MKNQFIIKRIVFTTAAIATVLAGFNACADNPAAILQPEFPKIILQPEDQLAPIGSNATFSVTAENADGYQWLRNGNALVDATNSSFTVQNAQTTDVGYYSCSIFKGAQPVPTRAASLMVYVNSIDPQTGVDPAVIYALPILGSGSQGTCPGSYIGYVSYTKSYTNGWGWTPDTTRGNTIFTATDTNRTNTKVQYLGEYGDGNCNQTTVTVPNPPYSPAYEFCIFFTNNVPTNAYPITLDGFNP
ncbi:MAG: immunoglobulin domain-containing protein [Limisphaerales bacterium]